MPVHSRLLSIIIIWTKYHAEHKHASKALVR
jgi:hypothetical protein